MQVSEFSREAYVSSPQEQHHHEHAKAASAFRKESRCSEGVCVVVVAGCQPKPIVARWKSPERHKATQSQLRGCSGECRGVEHAVRVNSRQEAWAAHGAGSNGQGPKRAQPHDCAGVRL